MQGQNALYKKQQTQRLINYKLQGLAKRDMTYILGARCSDGVVLVADTKITIDEGAKFAYGKKLFKISDAVVMGASGISGFFSSFQNRVEVTSAKLTKQGVNLNTPASVKLLAENVIREMNSVYEEDRYTFLQQISVCF
jgi:20S proteasome alpha/beta subunit